MKPRVLAIVGPTASGKSDLALAVAQRTGGEIVSADSMQIYRGMDIGTAKPSREEQQRIVHHMIDIVDPDCSYSAGRYQQEACRAIADIEKRGHLPILVGGSGLYVNAVTCGLDFSSRPQADPELRARLEKMSGEELYRRLLQIDQKAAARIHPHNIVRVRRALEIAMTAPDASYDFEQVNSAYDFTIIGLMQDREELYSRINRRVDIMMERGLADEVRTLVNRFGTDSNAMQAIGYKEIISFYQGELSSLQDASDCIKRNTRHFAKRQMTWFKRDSRIRWLKASTGPDTVLELLKQGDDCE